MNLIKKCLAFVVILFIINKLFLYKLDKIIKKPDSSKISWMMNLENENITNLFIGASKVENDINPLLIEKNTLDKTINCGYHGFSFIDQYIIISQLLKKNHIKNLFIEVDPLTFLSFNFSKYNLYVNSYIPFKNAVELQKYVSKEKLFCFEYIPFYRYLDFKQEIDNYLKETSNDYDLYNGYLQHEYKPYNSRLISADIEKLVDAGCINIKSGYYQTEISGKQIRFLKKIIELSIENNINVSLILFPLNPNFKKYQSKFNGYNESKMIRNRLIKHYNITFIDHENIFNDNNLFVDDLHLNNIGAEKYGYYLSKIFSDSNSRYK